ncbi:MAG: UvrD-helicase domain-containing protein [Bacillaceae bacterium]|nr:UvrD-helicase domain-containing protein [Bacillaceae bacterium]
MSGVTPTPNQWKAISDLDSHLAITAGAGAGKTWVLTERYAAMLAGRPLVNAPEGFSMPARRPPSRPSEIVAITFTREAATEMKTRIRKRLRDWQDEEPDQAALIERHMEELEDAVITTIHGFCSELIRMFPLQAETDPDFKLVEPEDSQVLLEESIRRVLDEGLSGEDETVIRLLQSIPYETLVAEWMQFYPSIREYTEDFESVARRTVARMQEAVKKVPPMVERFEPYLNRLLRVDPEELPAKPQAALRRLQKKWEDGWNRVWEAWTSSDFYYTEDVFEIFNYLRDSRWGKSKKIMEYLEPIHESLDTLLKHISAHELEQAILDTGTCLARVHAVYEQRKKKENVLDFTDLQTKAAALMDNPGVQKELKNKFKYLMVDEFQDTNPVQFRLITQMMQILPDLRLFIVGDSKQSIYRFRGADVELFLKSQQRIQKEQGKVINLEENFRSQSSVITTVNQVFSKVMHLPETEGLPLYSSVYDFPMKATQPDYHHHANIELLHVGSKSVEDEAAAVARRIRELTEEERIPVETDNGMELRRVRYGDVALLFSSTGRVPVFEKALQREGIPYYILGSRNFFRRQEIWDLYELLHYLVREDDARSLMAVLRSPLFQLSDETLFLLGQDGQLLDNWTSGHIPPEVGGIERNRLLDARRLLDEWRDRARTVTPYGLLREIIQTTGYEQVLFMMPSGAQRVGNVRKFLELLGEKEKQGYTTVRRVVPYLKRLIESGADEEEAQVENADSDVVKIMTIHKSKGLEFPVVILPNLQKRFNMQMSRFAFDPELGLSVSLDGENFRHLGITADIREREKDKEREEEKRKLYVGMTRARDHLILSCASPIPKTRTVYDMNRATWWSWLVYAMADGEIQQIEENLQSFPVPVQYQYLDEIRLEEASASNEEAAEADGDKANPFAGLKSVVPDDPPEGMVFDRETVEANMLQLTSVSEIVKEKKGEAIPPDELERNEDSDRPFAYHLHRSDAADGPARDGLSAAERGTLVHAVLERWPFDGDQIRSEQVARIVHKKLVESGRFDLDPEPVLKEVHRHLNRIPGSRLLDELKHAERIWRELPFVIRDPEKTNRLINGTIDLIYQLPGQKAVVVDYKTNDTDRHAITDMVDYYREQLDLYAEVVEQVLNLKVDRRILFFTHSGDEVEV